MSLLKTFAITTLKNILDFKINKNNRKAFCLPVVFLVIAISVAVAIDGGDDGAVFALDNKL